ncbi:MAG: hypothetical protein JW878_06105 [Methanomicrobia archaeon]|nr:hypothetical protein [Methanomicrobia archaeon]
MLDKKAQMQTLEAVISALLMLSALTFVMLAYAPQQQGYSAVQLQKYGEDALMVISFYPEANITVINVTGNITTGNISWTDEFSGNESHQYIDDNNSINLSGGDIRIENNPFTRTYDFSSGAGTNKWAWEDEDIPSDPNDQGDPASSSNYTSLSTSDDNRWVTDIWRLGGVDYNIQLYNVTINESPSTISELNISWEGHGTGSSGYDTTLWIWDHSVGIWHRLQTEDAMGTEGWLNGSVTDAEDFISGETITVLASAEESGCPFIYGWTGEEYELLDLLFTGSFNARYEGSSFVTTTNLAVKNGCYEAIVFMALPDDGYINSLDLQVVEHPENTSVLPDDYGTLHTITNPLPVSAVDNEGKDITGALAAQDLDFWGSNVSTTRDFNDTHNLYDWITITLPKNESEAKLLVNMRITDFTELKLWYYNHYLLGTPNCEYLLDLVETDEEFATQLDQTIFETVAPLIQFWNGTAWYTHSAIPISSIYFDVAPKVIPLNLTANVGNQIRIVIPFACHDFDYVAVDYSPDSPVTSTWIRPIEAETRYVNGTVEDVLENVTDTDTGYARITQGDFITFRFPAMNTTEGLDRTYIFCASGYYDLVGSVVPEDKIYNLDLLYNLTYTPYAYTKWMIPRYLHPEDYPYESYYHITSVKEPFPCKGHHSLHSDYLKVVVSGIGYEFSANLTSVPITATSSRSWNKFYASSYTSSLEGTAISFKILNATDNSTICDTITAAEAAQGYDLGLLRDSGVSSIRLYAELSTSDNRYTPVLHDWSVDLIATSALMRAVENRDWNGLDEKIDEVLPEYIEYNLYFLDDTGEIMLDGTAKVEHGLPGPQAVAVDKLVYARDPRGTGYNVYEVQLVLWFR